MATLGGDSVIRTIEALNSGTIKPDEIIICIPEKEAPRVTKLPFDNITVIITKCRGQVAQRAIGFQKASNKYVMQIDDDIIVENKCIEKLLGTYRKGDNSITVAPAFINISTGESVYVKPVRNKMLDKIYYWLVNGSKGYQPGRIDKSSCPVGVDPKCENTEIVRVDWLAGGCLMHRKENLVLDNYYPFSGKAFCEDIIHSHLLKKKGVSLLVNTEAVCRLEIIPSKSYVLSEFVRNLVADYRARKYFAQISGRSVIRMNIFYLAWCMSYLSNVSRNFIYRLFPYSKTKKVS